MNEKISIIVPVYNLENYLERCVRSLCRQTYENLEIILVDDGSTDSSSRLCDAMAEGDKRIICIHKKNGGLSSARNRGLEKATGSYVLFVDGDDYIHPDMVRDLLESLIRCDVRIGICDYQHFSREEDVENPDTGCADEVLEGEDILRCLYLPERARFIMACCKLIDRALFEGIRFPEGRYREDEFTTYRLLLKVNKALCVNKRYYYYYQREDSIMHSFQIKRETDYYDALLERHEYLIKHGYSEEQLHRDSEFCIKQLYNFIFLWHGMKDEERRKYQNAYNRMYDLCHEEGRGMGVSGFRYRAARYFPGLLHTTWRIKKRIEGADMKK